ncbi:MAG: hypothetical protein ABH952_06375 [Candidatus Omnitrophota bacterium]
MDLLWIYGLMTVFSAVFLFLIAIGGGDTEVGVDADVDVGGFDGNVPESAGPGMLNLKLILSFILGFGAAGYMAVFLSWSIYHVIAGLIGGIVIWFMVYKVLSWLYKQQATSHVRGISFVGAEGTITVPIPKGGAGEIQARNPNTQSCMFFRAVAIDQSKEFARGDIVKIKSVDNGTARVE